ncbi:MAG: hypothetical protein AB7W37_10610 [Syntrophobacteraceae bacterium]|jgi:hypothetical protein
MTKRYVIGEKAYVQRPLVLGQVERLAPLLESAAVAEDGGMWEIARLALDPGAAEAFAVVLVEEGDAVRDAMETVDERAEELRYAMTVEQAVEVAGDFFGCNRASSVLEKLLGMAVKAREEAARTAGSWSACSTGSREET